VELLLLLRRDDVRFFVFIVFRFELLLFLLHQHAARVARGRLIAPRAR